jgi:hypothetical protein
MSCDCYLLGMINEVGQLTLVILEPIYFSSRNPVLYTINANHCVNLCYFYLKCRQLQTYWQKNIRLKIYPLMHCLAIIFFIERLLITPWWVMSLFVIVIVILQERLLKYGDFFLSKVKTF